MNGRLEYIRKSYTRVTQKNARLYLKRETPDLLMKKYFIPQNSKEDALPSARIPLIPQTETYVIKSEQRKSMANYEVYHLPGPMPPTVPFTTHSVKTYSDRLEN